jgi:hypothetical protein
MFIYEILIRIQALFGFFFTVGGVACLDVCLAFLAGGRSSISSSSSSSSASSSDGPSLLDDPGSEDDTMDLDLGESNVLLFV